jgi:hypothetical protein
MLHNFNTNTSAILQPITMTSHPDIGNILIAIFYWFNSFIFNGKLSVEQIWQTTLKYFFFHKQRLTWRRPPHTYESFGFFDGVEKNVFQEDSCERIVKILQKLLYNTRPLGPLLPLQHYSTRFASSSHKISSSAVKAILTDFYCKILLTPLYTRNPFYW